MLKEIRDARQVPNEDFRRWFYDTNLDLLVWSKPDATISGFQLCYDKDGQEKALRWFENRGFSHDCVDGGDESPLKNRSAVLVSDGPFDAARVLACLKAEDAELPTKIRNFVRRKLGEYGQAIRASGSA